MALALEGTTEAPHFAPAAAKVARTFATLAAFAPIPNAWGRQGWTVVTLSEVDGNELGRCLEMAWMRSKPTKNKPTRRK